MNVACCLVPAGKSLVLLVSASGWQDLSPLAGLSPDAFAGIVISSYSGRNHDEARKHKLAPAGDDCMRHLAALKRLDTLVLFDSNISNAGLEALTQFPSLQRLAITSDELDDEDLAHIARVDTLTGLRIYTGTGISDASMERLSQFPALRALRLGVPRISETGMAHLAGMPSLEVLELYVSADGGGMFHLAKLSKIRQLRLNVRNAGSDDLSFLAELEQLEHLGIEHWTADDCFLPISRIPHLKNIRSLDSVALYGGRFTDEGLNHLSELPLLESLSMPNNSGFTGEGLMHLGKLANLKELHLRGENITDAGLRELAGLKKLESLDFVTPSLEAKAFERKFRTGMHGR